MTPESTGLDFGGLAGKVVSIVTTEGELLRALINMSSWRDQDLTYRVLTTSQPERYSSDPPGSWSCIPWRFVAHIEVEPAEAAEAGPRRQA